MGIEIKFAIFRLKISLFLLLLSVLFSFVMIAEAATYTVFPTDDTYVEERSPYNVKGALNYIQIGGDSSSMYGFLKFNFDFIDEDEYVVSAILSITGWWVGTNNSSIELYLVDDDSWNEQTLSWSNLPSCEMNDDNLLGTQNYFFPFAELQWNLLETMEWDSLFQEDDDTQLSLLLVSLSEIDNMFFFTKEGYFSPFITIVTETVDDNSTGDQATVPLPSSFWLLCIPCVIYFSNRHIDLFSLS